MSYSPNNKGFTLIEVIACIGIISVGLVAAITIRNDNLCQASKAASQSRAVGYASSIIEDMVIEYQQNGFFITRSGQFDKSGDYRWEAYDKDVLYEKIGPMVELVFVFRYPTPNGEETFSITRIIEKPNATN